MLGGSNGQPDQVFFARGIPVSSEVLDGGFVRSSRAWLLTTGGLNVNANTLPPGTPGWARLGARRWSSRTDAGVLDEGGATLPVLEAAGVEQLVGGGTATAGMIAKLRACEHALTGGVDDA